MRRPKKIQDMATPAQPAANNTKCALLTLPAELRNKIYALVYPCAGTVELLNSDLLKSGTATPSKALLMTCRQIYEEARYVYCAVWDETEFTITVNDDNLSPWTDRTLVSGCIRAMEEWRLERVRRVRVRFVGGADDGAECILSGGVWTMQDATQDSQVARQAVLIPSCKTERARRLGLTVFKVEKVPSYRFVDVTGLPAGRVEIVKLVLQRKNLRKEELVAIVRKVGVMEEAH